MSDNGDGGRKSFAEMIGEFLREAAVLLIIFEVAARLFWPEGQEPAPAGKLLVVFGIGITCLTAGIAIELSRRIR